MDSERCFPGLSHSPSRFHATVQALPSSLLVSLALSKTLSFWVLRSARTAHVVSVHATMMAVQNRHVLSGFMVPSPGSDLSREIL
ncbi:MAG: hypothetical protein ACE5JM_02015 [Armatimonadota bacterium]